MFKIIVLIFLLVMLVWAFGTLERRSLYYPDKEMVATPAIDQLAFDEVFLKTSDGVRIHGWFIPGPIKGKPAKTIALFHGNAGNISHRLDKLLELRKLGVNVLLLDYRGYGKSGGSPSEQGTYRDGEAAYTYLTEKRKIPPADLIFYGESLGCAVAIEMARRHPAGGLILESPFTSTIAMGKLVFPWLPVRWMVRYRYDNLTKISELHLPILIMHSPQDDVVPFAMGQQLYAAAPQPKTFFELSGDHNAGYEITGRRYVDAIRSFMHGINKS
jgi:uncharacterized protein